VGNLRLGFKAILGIALFFSTFHFNYAEARACGSIFGSVSDRPLLQSQGLKENTKLKIVTWNVLNLKIPEVDFPEGSDAYNRTSKNDRTKFSKSTYALRQMKRVFDDLNADIYVFQEVFSEASLRHVVETYMNDNYDVVVEKGNDNRGMGIGFLIKKSLNVNFEMRSHKNLKYKNDHGVYPAGTEIFARDVPALFLRQKDGSNSRASDEPDLIVLGAHLKSKRPTNGDFESTNFREVEAQTAAQIATELNETYQNVPLILAGDFNTKIMEASETKSLREALKESLSLMGDKLSKDDKVTHTFHPFKGQSDYKQVDAHLLNDAMVSKLIDSQVYHYKDQSGNEIQYKGKWETKIYPIYFSQRKKNPSDHMPIVSTFDMTR
jgi:endonuclease/exonuclease/phosphatase family metal-dependent hydrolase